jgi:outer membrane immunogenic protein
MMTGDTSHSYTGVRGSGPRRSLTRETSKVAPFGLRPAATAIALALATTYAAADGIPGVVMTDSQYVTDWSGFYIGGKLGGAFSSSINWTQDENLFSASPGAAAAPNTPLDFSPNGIAGGFVGGANLQPGQWIFGAEVSFSGTDLSQKTTSPFFPATDTFSTTLDWLLTVEGRIGYTWDRVMVFGKGGLAATDATLKVTSSSPLHGGTASVTEFAKGWIIGGGIEYAAWNSVILGIEYDYMSIDLSKGGDCPLCDAGLTIDSTPSAFGGDAKMSAVMLRASYLFMPED